MKQTLTILLALTLLQGCATAYQSKGPSSGGYSETQLDENVFQVAFRGNAYTDSERASDFTMLRSAELTLQNGYKYFVITESDSQTSNSTYTRPGVYYAAGNVYGGGTRGTGGAGNKIATGGHAFGGATKRSFSKGAHTISRPSASNTIACFNEKPKDALSYDAESIYQSITKKYDITLTAN